MAWDPQQYLKFAGPRLRPGLDLLAAIPEIAATRIIDLGCGTGHLASQLARRWPEAQVTGLDSSVEMLERAAREFPATDWPSLTWAEAETPGNQASQILATR